MVLNKLIPSRKPLFERGGFRNECVVRFSICMWYRTVEKFFSLLMMCLIWNRAAWTSAEAWKNIKSAKHTFRRDRRIFTEGTRIVCCEDVCVYYVCSFLCSTLETDFNKWGLKLKVLISRVFCLFYTKCRKTQYGGCSQSHHIVKRITFILMKPCEENSYSENI